jgi:hypothetical protein
MAIRLINRPSVTLQEPESGLDVFLKEVSKYASPEYQLRRKESQRADARLDLQQQQVDETSKAREQSLQSAQAQEMDRKTKFKQEQIDRNNKQAIDEFSIMYDGTSVQGLDMAEQFLKSNLAESEMYSALQGKISKDRGMLQKKNEKIDNLALRIQELKPDFEYNPDTDRNFIDKQGSFIMKNLLSQGMFGDVPENIRVQYSQDMKQLNELTESALSQIKSEDRDRLTKSIVGPAYKSFLKKYNTYNFSSPAIEGMLTGVGYDFAPIDLSTVDKLDGVDIDEIIGEPKSEEAPDYIQLIGMGTPKSKDIQNKLGERGELNFLEEAASPESVLVPAGKELRKAVKASRNDLEKSLGSIKFAERGVRTGKMDVSDKEMKERVNSFKNAVVNAVNLYNSIDPTAGRGGKGGASERKAIAKLLNKYKERANQSRFMASTLRDLDPSIIELLNSINLNEPKPRNRRDFLEGLGGVIASPSNPTPQK